mgnify:CR=1 FL=1
MSRLFGATAQLGLVVRDFDAAIAHWSQVHGVGPFFHFRQVEVADYRYRGQSGPAPVVSIAFGYSGDLQVEIICQHNDAPSCYTEFLDSGREGIHHISAFHDSAGFDAAHAAISASGSAPLHEGSIGGIRFAYFDTDTQPAACVCEISESGIPAIAELFAGFRQAAYDWDGSEPLRPMPGAVA